MKTMVMTTIRAILPTALSGLKTAWNHSERESSTKSSQLLFVLSTLSKSHVPTRTMPMPMPMPT